MTASVEDYLPRYRFTVHDYHRMGEAGILTEDDRVELIEGEIVTMSPIGSGHAGRVNKLTRLLVLRVGDHGLVSVQNPVRLSEYSEPQPDFAVLKPSDDDYTSRHPNASDVLLLVEIADSSLGTDRRVKVPLYARHGVPVVWLVNLKDEVVEVHSEPSESGYQRVEIQSGDDVLTLDAVPDFELRPAEVF